MEMRMENSFDFVHADALFLRGEHRAAFEEISMLPRLFIFQEPPSTLPFCITWATAYRGMITWRDSFIRQRFTWKAA